MSLLTKLGRKHLEQATQWVPSAILYGSSAGAALCFFTEWKLILQYLPYYNGKYVKSE